MTHAEDLIEPDYIPFPNPDVMIQEESKGCAVLVNFDTGKAVSLNDMGRFIWKAADGNTTVAEIVKVIKQNFLSVPEDASEHVSGIVYYLKLHGFFGWELKNN